MNESVMKELEAGERRTYGCTLQELKNSLRPELCNGVFTLAHYAISMLSDAQEYLDSTKDNTRAYQLINQAKYILAEYCADALNFQGRVLRAVNEK